MPTRTDEFSFDLPPDLIAQEPAPRRDASRLMVLDRQHRSIAHSSFAAIGAYLNPGDLLIANRSRVIPARLTARKPTGGAVELLLMKPCLVDTWLALARPSRRLAVGLQLRIDRSSLVGTLLEDRAKGQWMVRFDGESADIRSDLLRAGSIPLPPYIPANPSLNDRYQTIYGDRDGSIAAPTAGLHFTDELMCRLRSNGVGIEFVTLHVGVGTFKPVEAAFVHEHRMHPEWGEVSLSVADAANEARATGHRVIAVGTTTTRLLESAFVRDRLVPFDGETNRFIYPGYTFRAIDGLVTNFHLPRSTLLMLVSALAGRDFILSAYAEAVHERYRFYSFGDAMLIV